MNVAHEAVPIGEALAPRNEKVAPADYPELPYIGLDDIEAHSMRLLGSKPAASMKSSAKRFYPGDVLYSRLRPYLNKVWSSDRNGICSSEFIVIPGNQLVDPSFLALRLNAIDFVSFANSLNAVTPFCHCRLTLYLHRGAASWFRRHCEFLPFPSPGICRVGPHSEARKPKLQVRLFCCLGDEMFAGYEPQLERRLRW